MGNNNLFETLNDNNESEFGIDDKDVLEIIGQADEDFKETDKIEMEKKEDSQDNYDGDTDEEKSDENIGEASDEDTAEEQSEEDPDETLEIENEKEEGLETSNDGEIDDEQ